MQQLDPRLVSISVTVNGQLKTYSDLNISATGTKYANANQNECEVKITNLDKETADFLLTETSPFNLNRTPKIITVNAGRVSYGTTRIFSGTITAATITQPPDVMVTLKAATGNFDKGNVIAKTQTGTASVKKISEQAASELGIALNFEATDKMVSNYSYSGAALKQVDKINSLGLFNAYIDDSELIVKDLNLPLPNRLKVLNLDTGMVGIPEMTETGIKVKFLIDNYTTLGGGLQVQSVMYPGANGNYVIYKLSFEITNRDDPFYWIAEAKRI